MENPLLADTTRGDAEIPFLQDLRAELHKHSQPEAHKCALRYQLLGTATASLGYSLFAQKSTPVLANSSPSFHINAC